MPLAVPIIVNASTDRVAPNCPCAGKGLQKQATAANYVLGDVTHAAAARTPQPGLASEDVSMLVMCTRSASLAHW
jgi:hypothetical protein